MRSLRWLRQHLDPERRRRLLGPWLLANVGYDAAHTAVMIGIFHRYGLNPWVYAAYIVVFSLGFGWSTLALVGALVDGEHRRAWGISALAVVCFFAPELFLVTTTHHVPRYVYVLLAGYVSVSTTVAVVTLVRRFRANRAAHRAAGRALPNGAVGTARG